MQSLEKKQAYNFFWGMSDAQMQELFPSLDGFWSKTTHKVKAVLDSSGQRTLLIDQRWAWNEQSWSCPCCNREKCEIAKVGQSDKLIFTLAEHHDHGSDFFSRYSTVEGKLVERFAPILVCSDCNVAEANAKVAVRAESWFTFTPEEIKSFINIAPNRSHVIDVQKVEVIYRNQEPKIADRIGQICDTYSAFGTLLEEEFKPTVFKCQTLFETLSKTTGLSVSSLIWRFDCRSRTHFANKELHPERSWGGRAGSQIHPEI